jgi:hypothetical protein
MKVCIHCNISKPEKSFEKTSSGNRGNVCHLCRKHRRNKEYLQRKYKRDNLKKRYKRYKLSEQEYVKMFEEQNGACKICKSPQEKLHIDHSHTTGEVRGLLCLQCNVGLGMMRDSPDILRAALTYLS